MNIHPDANDQTNRAPSTPRLAGLNPALRRARSTDTPRTAVRGVLTITTWIGFGFVATVFLALTALGPFGYHSYIVRSPSMRPAINAGDIVIDHTIPATAARIGDTITYRDPQQLDRTITHRVRAIKRRGTTLTFTTMGIANNTTQTWSLPANGSIGRVTLRVPELGRLLAATQNETGLILLVLTPTFSLAIISLQAIWTNTKRRTTTPPHARQSNHRISELRTLVHRAEHPAPTTPVAVHSP